MSTKYAEKSIKLSLELDRYLASHPSAYDKIPRGACVIITQKGDANFNEQSRQIAEKSSERCVEARKAGRHWTIRELE